MFQVLNLGGLQSPTHKRCKFEEARALHHQQFQWLNCEGPIAARYFNHPCHIKVVVRTAARSSLFVETVYI